MPSNTPQLVKQSTYNQGSFKGGMNLLGDDTRLDSTQYRLGVNLTNRYDQLDPILQSKEDSAVPGAVSTRIIQEFLTFGLYEIIFISGNAFYKLYNQTGWKQISNFQMSKTAPRFWTVLVPVATTNYVRYAATGSVTSNTNPAGVIQTAIVAGASKGNIAGILVQDNIEQPQFIFLDVNGIPQCRTTQSITQWSISFTDATNTVVATDPSGNVQDFREYVPIGNSMTWDDGILYITSQDTNFLYRSVSGRPLDFVVNVTNKLATNVAATKLVYPNTTSIKAMDGVQIAPFTQTAGGDASSTSYSVGVGGITCIRPLSSGGIFVSASGANFSVITNKTQNAPMLFGEYTFIRTFLFNATCLSDRVIFDTLGDTRFVDLYGVRSFNAIEQLQNEGDNSPFTAAIQAVFGTENNPVIQDLNNSAGGLFNNYELYFLSSSIGPIIAKYDTMNSCWTSFDIGQTGGKLVKIFAKIELGVRTCYAVTEDNRLFQLYIGPETATASCRTIGICASTLYANTDLKMNNPENEVKLLNCRAIVNNIKENVEVSFIPYVNNRLTKMEEKTKTVTYSPPVTPSSNIFDLPDVDTQLNNIYWNCQECDQGWKIFGLFTWDNCSITQFSMEMNDVHPVNPLKSQGVVV